MPRLLWTSADPQQWCDTAQQRLMQLAEAGLARSFVVKTVDKGGKKAFINVCSHDKMPLPSNWAGSEVSLGLVVPLLADAGPSCHSLSWRLTMR